MREEIERLSADTYVVLLTELLGERGAHDVATNAGRSAEVRLARLAAGGVDGWEGIVNYFSAWFGYIVASASCLQELTIVTDFEGRRGIVKVS